VVIAAKQVDDRPGMVLAHEERHWDWFGQASGATKSQT